MTASTDGLRQLAQFISPANLKHLRAAGAVHPKGPIALVRNIPRLLSRGPSLGIVTAMNALVLRDKPAVVDRLGTRSWEQIDRDANRAARMLMDLGVRPGDRIALLLRNGRELSALLLGAQKAGIVTCPLNTWAKPKELEATIASSDASVLVYDVRHSTQLEAVGLGTARLVHVGETDEALPRSEPYEQLLAAATDKALPAVTRDRGSTRIVIHTSGTTGTPKGAARSPSRTGIGALADILSVVPYRREDVILVPSPMFHSFGLATFMFGCGLGATVVLPDRFDAEETLALIERHRVTALSLVPVMIRRVVDLPDEVKSRYDVSSLRVLLASGSLLSEDLRAEARTLFGDVIYDLYGSTEAGWVAIASPEDMARRPGSVGRPVRGIDIAVFDSQGGRLPPGETGELFVRSDAAFDGYTNSGPRDEREGFMSIGDLGHLDEEGYLFVGSRADDMVVVGGENVYPIEVEQVIEGVSGVHEAYVLGRPDPEYGHVLVAAIVGDASPEAVLATCRAELASYKVPKEIFVRDELPRTSTGKVLKRELLASIDTSE